MADYTKSPVFSSPAYWIALGVGVVGIGAAALQERKGSAAKDDIPLDPQTDDLVRLFMINKYSGVAMPEGKNAQGKTIGISKQQASKLIRSMGDRVSASGIPAQRPSSTADNRTWMQEMYGTPAAFAAEKKRLVNYSEKLTQKRLDADEAMLNRRFGGLVSLVSGMPRSITKTGAIDAAEANHTLWTLVYKDNGAYLRPGRYWPNDTHRAYYKSKLPWTNADMDLDIAWSKPNWL